MDTMLSALNNTENLKIKELTVSAIGAIGENGLRTEMIDGLLWNVNQQSTQCYTDRFLYKVTLSPLSITVFSQCCQGASGALLPTGY